MSVYSYCYSLRRSRFILPSATVPSQPIKWEKTFWLWLWLSTATRHLRCVHMRQRTEFLEPGLQLVVTPSVHWETLRKCYKMCERCSASTSWDCRAERGQSSITHRHSQQQQSTNQWVCACVCGWVCVCMWKCKMLSLSNLCQQPPLLRVSNLNLRLSNS